MPAQTHTPFACVCNQLAKLTLNTHTSTMQVTERLDYATSVETSRRIVERRFVAQNCPQFSAQTDFHQHVQILAVLERSEQSEQKTANQNSAFVRKQAAEKSVRSKTATDKQRSRRNRNVEKRRLR